MGGTSPLYIPKSHWESLRYKLQSRLQHLCTTRSGQQVNLPVCLIRYDPTIDANPVASLLFQPPSLATLPPQFPHFPLLSPSSNHQVLQQMVLGSTTTAEHGGGPPGVHTYTLYGQHLFMNGPTIAHPPTATAD